MRSVHLMNIVQITSVIPPGCVKLLLLVLPCNFSVLALLTKLLVSSLHSEKAWVLSCCTGALHSQLASGEHPAQQPANPLQACRPGHSCKAQHEIHWAWGHEALHVGECPPCH